MEWPTALTHDDEAGVGGSPPKAATVREQGAEAERWLQWLRVLPALPGDPGNHLNSNFRGPNTLFWPPCAPAYTGCTYAHINSYLHITKRKKVLKKGLMDQFTQ